MARRVRSYNNSDAAMVVDDRLEDRANRHLFRVLVHVSAALEFVNTRGQSALTERLTYGAVKGNLGIRKRSENKLRIRMNTFVKIEKTHNTLPSRIAVGVAAADSLFQSILPNAN
ncbi:MAG TPA: hypothetical protein VNV41_16280 [Candidatus Acidoferrales bacterium]|nr:hypothetical protein [Candidatus Acidoferrales bacterium]